MLPGPFTTDAASARPRALLDSALVLLGTFAVCAAATRGVWHGLDAYQFLSDIDHGQLYHDRHPLYLPIAWLFAKALQPLGLSLFAAVGAASSVCTAIGAGFCHRALLGLGLSRKDAMLAAVANAGCFAVLYFGTVIEVHGTFFGFVGVAWWAWSKLLARPGAGRAAIAGAASGLATVAHATGHLLVGAFAVFALAWARRPLDRRWPLWLGVLAVAHAVTARLVGGTLLHLLDPTQQKGAFDGALGHIRNMLALGTDWSTTPRLLWQEWLQPFLPISLVPFLAPWFRAARLEAAMLLGCVAVYLAAAVVLLSPTATLSHPQYLPPLTLIEYGAYFLPLALPGAVIAVRHLPPRWRPLVPIATLALGLHFLYTPDRPPGDLAWGRAVLELIDDEHAYVLCGGFRELDPVKQLRPSIAEPQFLSVYVKQIQAFTYRETMTYVFATAWFDAVMYDGAQRHGGQLVVTEDAMAILRGTHDGFLDRLANEHIPAHYDLVPMQHGVFRGLRVVRRP